MTDTTARGFAIRRLFDSNGYPYSIQESSVATDDMIWLGGGHDRLHLNRDDARILAFELMHFANTGEIAIASKEPPQSKQPVVDVAEWVASLPDPGLSPQRRDPDDEPGAFDVLDQHFRKQRA